MSETGQSTEGGAAGGFKMADVVNQCLEVNGNKTKKKTKHLLCCLDEPRERRGRWCRYGR